MHSGTEFCHIKTTEPLLITTTTSTIQEMIFRTQEIRFSEDKYCCFLDLMTS